MSQDHIMCTTTETAPERCREDLLTPAQIASEYLPGFDALEVGFRTEYGLAPWPVEIHREAVTRRFLLAARRHAVEAGASSWQPLEGELKPRFEEWKVEQVRLLRRTYSTGSALMLDSYQTDPK